MSSDKQTQPQTNTTENNTTLLCHRCAGGNHWEIYSLRDLIGGNEPNQLTVTSKKNSHISSSTLPEISDIFVIVKSFSLQFYELLLLAFCCMISLLLLSSFSISLRQIKYGMAWHSYWSFSFSRLFTVDY